MTKQNENALFIVPLAAMAALVSLAATMGYLMIPAASGWSAIPWFILTVIFATHADRCVRQVRASLPAAPEEPAPPKRSNKFDLEPIESTDGS